jgi:hypothetical protein
MPHEIVRFVCFFFSHGKDIIVTYVHFLFMRSTIFSLLSRAWLILVFMRSIER